MIWNHAGEAPARTGADKGPVGWPEMWAEEKFCSMAYFQAEATRRPTPRSERSQRPTVFRPPYRDDDLTTQH